MRIWKNSDPTSLCGLFEGDFEPRFYRSAAIYRFPEMTQAGQKILLSAVSRSWRKYSETFRILLTLLKNEADAVKYLLTLVIPLGEKHTFRHASKFLDTHLLEWSSL